MSVLTPEEIFQTKQPIHIDDLIATAVFNNFEVRNGGKASHIPYIHKIHRDISGGFIISKNKIGAQRTFARNLFKIQEKEAEAILSASQKFTQAADLAAAERLSSIQEQLPDYVEAFYGDNQEIIVRDRQVPQIGFTLHSPEEDRLFENKLRHELDSTKREFCILLHRCNMEDDMSVGRDSAGNFTGKIGHELYGIAPITIPPYPESTSPFEMIFELQQQVLKIDIDHLDRKQTILSKPFISDSIFVSYSARRGERNNHLRYQGEDGRTTLSIAFKTHSNQRAKGDGSIARISEDELQRVEKTVADIENNRSNHRAHQAA